MRGKYTKDDLYFHIDLQSNASNRWQLDGEVIGMHTDSSRIIASIDGIKHMFYRTVRKAVNGKAVAWQYSDHPLLSKSEKVIQINLT